MRIVLDTNVLARTTPGPSSPAREVLQRAANAPHVLLIAAPLLEELARVLRYERLRRMHGLTDEQIDAHVHFVEIAGLLVPLPVGLAPAAVPHDPDDDPVVATAIVGQAHVICTWDRHLRHPDVSAYCQKHGIEVMNDVELLRILRQSEQQTGDP